MTQKEKLLYEIEKAINKDFDLFKYYDKDCELIITLQHKNETITRMYVGSKSTKIFDHYNDGNKYRYL